jgi:hypothetical protein
MDVLTLSRLQFAITAMFHFIFVPLTLGLSVMVAYMESCYVRTNNEMYLKMTKFWGKLFLINFALGLVTHLRQIKANIHIGRVNYVKKSVPNYLTPIDFKNSFFTI